MKDREQLVNIILLLVNESYHTSKNSTVKHLVEDALDSIKLPLAMVGVTDEANVIERLKELTYWLLEHSGEAPIEIDHIITKLKVISINFKGHYDLIIDELGKIPEKSQKKLKQDCQYYYNAVKDFIDDLKFSKKLKQLSFDYHVDSRVHTDKQAFLERLVTELSAHAAPRKTNGLNIHGINSALSLSNRDDVAKAIETAQQISSDDGLMVTDIQGWNDLFGGGIRRGEIIDLDALTGRGKSDTVRRILRGIMRSNKPYMLDPTRKPAMVILTLEDTPEDILNKMYCDIVEEETGVSVDITKTDRFEVAEYLQSYLGVNGYNLLVYHGDKHEVNFDGFKRMVEYIESEGYEIHMLALDYLQLMRSDDQAGANPPTQLKMLFGRLGDCTKQRKTTLITCNQFDSKAKELVRNTMEFAKEAVGKNYQENCKSLTNEVDLELAAHVVTGAESEDGFAYHQLARGKHRAGKKTPVGDRYAVYRMHCTDDGKPIGFIKGDLNGASQVRNRTSGALRADGGKEIW